MSVETDTLTGSVYEVDRYTSYVREGATSPNFLLGDGGVGGGKRDVDRERGWGRAGLELRLNIVSSTGSPPPKTRTLFCWYRLG